MAKKTAGYEPIKTGLDPRKDTNNNWLKIDNNESVDAVLLVEADEIIACEQCAIWLKDGNSPVWVYLGPEDPSHELKVTKSYRAFLPMLVENEVKIFSMSKSVHTMILDIADASTELKGMEVRIKRTGTGLGTRYSIVPRGKRHDVSRIEEVDVIALLGPLTIEGVQELIAQKLEKESYEEVVELFRGKAAKAKAKKAAKEAAEAEEDDDLDDLELI